MAKFDRKKHGLRVSDLLDEGPGGTKRGDKLSKKQVASLSDDEIELLLVNGGLVAIDGSDKPVDVLGPTPEEQFFEAEQAARRKARKSK